MPAKKGAPGTRKQQREQQREQQRQQQQHHPAAPGLADPNTSKGKGKGKGGKGKGKGKGKGDGYDSAAESDGSGRKKTSDYPGKAVTDVPQEKRCCLHYLWTKKDGSSLCANFNKGVECWKGPHLPRATQEMASTNLYARLKAEHGKPNCPAGGPKKPAAPAPKAAAAGDGS